jgi:signal transduction histidine kinase
MTTAKAALIASIYTGAEMVPYWGRLSLRIARAVLAIVAFAWRAPSAAVLLGIYAVIALLLVYEPRRRARWLNAASLAADTAYLALWCRIGPDSWVPAVFGSYLMTSAVVLEGFARAATVAGLSLMAAALLPSPASPRLIWTTAALCGFAVALGIYKRYLDGRTSGVLKQNVIIRSRGESIRMMERERIAADFHDGPLQHFVSFQMRLEVIKKLLVRERPEAAAEELRQLQEVCQGQVADLRSFARNMRPTENGMGFAESLSRMVEVFQRDTGIQTTCFADGSTGAEPVEAAQDLLQIVREALHNIHKHSGASRVAISAAPLGESLQITVEDNGAGFPFSGKYNMEDLERLQLGPISIKRRVRLLNGELTIDSQPERGAKLEIRIPA